MQPQGVSFVSLPGTGASLPTFREETMSPENRPRPRRSGIEGEEERTWVDFYRRVRSDAVLAAEVLAQLERDPEMKHSRLALYLSCKETVRRDKARHARHQRIGSFVRGLAHALFVRPWHALRRIGGTGRDIAIELLPEVPPSPKPAVRALNPPAEPVLLRWQRSALVVRRRACAASSGRRSAGTVPRHCPAASRPDH